MHTAHGQSAARQRDPVTPRQPFRKVQTGALSRRRTQTGPRFSTEPQPCAHQGRTGTGHMLLPARRGPAWLGYGSARPGPPRLNSARLTRDTPRFAFQRDGDSTRFGSDALGDSERILFFSSLSFPALSGPSSSPWNRRADLD